MTFLESIGLLGSLEPETFQDAIAKAEPQQRGKYRHWNEHRHLTPPEGLTSEQWWAGVKLRRNALAKQVGSLRDLSGVPFVYVRADVLLERQHYLDQLIAGSVELPNAPWSSHQSDRFIARNFVEEAIASSQLEGASTTRKRAKEMIRHGQAPTTNAERMILNNYSGITRIAEVVDEPLSPDLIRELHAILTAGTLENSDAEGRFQTPEEERVVVGEDGTLEPLYVPPPAEAIPELIDNLCAFANEGDTATTWMHPLLRALALHFMLAWIHPFEDGNGRAARALFYWAALKADYWLMEYVSISPILLRAPAQYANSFLQTETDENDMTYFFLHQIDVIHRAVTGLFDYAARQAEEARRLSELLMDLNLNHRQKALVGHALRNPETLYTFYSHARSHRVVHVTARNDILGLERDGLLVRAGRVGRANAFAPADDLEARIEALAASTS